MAKKGKKSSYKFKLGSKASIFYDPVSQVKVLPNKITEFEGRMSARLSIALSHGHIVELNKDDAKELQKKLNDGQPIFENMNKGDLLKYYVDEFEVTDEEGAEFSKKSKGKMVEVLEDLTDDESNDKD